MIQKTKEKEEALTLRRNGMSYSEILKRISVARSTLSLWLRDVGLSQRQKQCLTEKKLKGMARGWANIRNRRIRKSEYIKEVARAEAEQLIIDPLWLTGVVLYWAEGGKERKWRTGEKVSFSNMEWRMHAIFLSWIFKYGGKGMNDLVFEIYIHESADIRLARKYWSRLLKIKPIELRIYLKRKNNNPHRHNINNEYHGLLRICVRRSVDLNRKIAGWIEGVVQYFSK